MKEKKAVSPVIATVLLVMIVIILAIIILLWARGFLAEALVKEISGEEKTVERYCTELKIKPKVDEVNDNFGFTNVGNVPIYSYNIKFTNGGSSSVVRVGQGGIVNPGFSTIAKDNLGVEYKYSTNEEIRIFPILLGKSDSGSAKEFQCPDVNGVLI
jgi:flagellin-like protein